MLTFSSKMPFFISQINKNVKKIIFSVFKGMGKLAPSYTVNESVNGSSLFKGCWTGSVTFFLA